MKECVECGQQFEFKTHNQKYCSNQCCRVATNKRIMVKYYEKRDRLSGKVRYCITCNTQLNKYNGEDNCGACLEKLIKSQTDDMVKGIESVISNFKKTPSKKSARN